MKKIVFSLLSALFLIAASHVQAQVQTDAAGIYIKGGTTFSTEGLVLVPATDLTLSNLSIQKAETVIEWPQHSSIGRVYRLSKPVAYRGAMTLNYLDTELNGNKADEISIAYSTVPNSINHRDYTITTGNTRDTNARSVGQSFTKEVSLAALTAVTPEVPDVPLAELLQPHNIISPNGDGVNDLWVIQNIERYPDNEVKVYDRFGRLVFSKKGYANTWDGRYNGAVLPEDTYYYVLTVNGGEQELKGFVGIVRENNAL